jgi:hypothetical protein
VTITYTGAIRKAHRQLQNRIRTPRAQIELLAPRRRPRIVRPRVGIVLRRVRHLRAVAQARLDARVAQVVDGRERAEQLRARRARVHLDLGVRVWAELGAVDLDHRHGAVAAAAHVAVADGRVRGPVGEGEGARRVGLGRVGAVPLAGGVAAGVWTG